MITADELHALHNTWDAAPPPDAVPEAAYRLWVTAHTLVNRRIPIEQGAYLHADANLHGVVGWMELAAEYDRTLTALRKIQVDSKFLQHLWRALHGWGLYDPTPEAREANRKAKVDRYRKESILDRLLRASLMGRKRG